MKKVILFAGLALMLCVQSAVAQPQAKEIAYAPSCAKGVHVYDKSADAVTCGTPHPSGTGYVIEMAADSNSTPQCPKGYNFIGLLQGTKSDAVLKHFACVKS